eukprot:3763173-Prymnesium_polylepis.1
MTQNDCCVYSRPNCILDTPLARALSILRESQDENEHRLAASAPSRLATSIRQPLYPISQPRAFRISDCAKRIRDQLIGRSLFFVKQFP